MNLGFDNVSLEKLEKYHQKNLTAHKGKIVFTGSSLMEMFPIEKFMDELKNPYIIYNRGMSGFKTEDMIKVLDVCVFELEPSRIFINIGTNDLSDPNIPLSQMLENYGIILDKIKKRLPVAELYLMAYYPVNYDAASEEMKPCLEIRNNRKITFANEEVKKLARHFCAKYIDINDNLKDEQGRLKASYTIEGMHIKEEGYRAILDDILRYVGEPAWKSKDPLEAMGYFL